MSEPIDVGISASASSGAESGGPFSGGGDIIFNSGSDEQEDGLGSVTGSDTLNPTSTASATAGGGTATAASGGPASVGAAATGGSILPIIIIALVGVAAFFLLRHHK
jgi:hypothetical protein